MEDVSTSKLLCTFLFYCTSDFTIQFLAVSAVGTSTVPSTGATFCGFQLFRFIRSFTIHGRIVNKLQSCLWGKANRGMRSFTSTSLWLVQLPSRGAFDPSHVKLPYSPVVSWAGVAVNEGKVSSCRLCLYRMGQLHS